MYSKFHYILIGLILTSVYLMYLIAYNTVQQFQTTNFIENLREANTQVEDRAKEKEFLASYIRTLAYQTQVAKATHNKKLQGEETINVIRGDEADANKDRDPAQVIAEAKAKQEDPMKNMTNPEKWLYMISTGI